VAYTSPQPGQRITAAMLAALAAEWKPYTATLSNISLGNGSVMTRYQQIANRVTVAWNVTWGSTTTGNMPALTLPIAPASLGGMRWSGDLTISRGTGSWRAGWAVLTDSSTSISTFALMNTGEITATLATAGITMTANGWIEGNLTYEV